MMRSVAIRRRSKEAETTVVLDRDGAVERLERLPSGSLLTDEWTISGDVAARIVSSLSDSPPATRAATSSWSFASFETSGRPDFQPIDNPSTSSNPELAELADLLSGSPAKEASPEPEPDPAKVEFNQEAVIVAFLLIAASIALVLAPPLKLLFHSEQFANQFDHVIVSWLARGVPLVLAFAPLYALAGLLAGRFASQSPTKVARNGAFYSLIVGFWGGALIPPATLLVLPFIAQVCASFVVRRRA